MPYGKAFGTVILDRAFDVVVLVGLLIVGLAAVASSAWLWQLAAAGAVVVLGIAGVLLFSRIYIGRRERDRRERSLVRRLVRDTVERLAEPLGRRHIAVWLGLSLAAWCLWAVAAYLVARALGVELSLTEALFVTAVLNLGSAVPSSPGYVGTYEWLGVASLGLLDVGHEPALAFTILVHAAWYVPTTLFGAISLGHAWRETARSAPRLARGPPLRRELTWREALAAAAGGVVLAIVMTWPLVLHLGSDIGKDLGDPLLQTWQVAWIGHALVHAPLHLWQANTFWPYDDTLAFSDALVGYAPVGVLRRSRVRMRRSSATTSSSSSRTRWRSSVRTCWRESSALAALGAVAAGAAFAYAPWRLVAERPPSRPLERRDPARAVPARSGGIGVSDHRSSSQGGSSPPGR